MTQMTSNLANQGVEEGVGTINDANVVVIKESNLHRGAHCVSVEKRERHFLKGVSRHVITKEFSALSAAWLHQQSCC